MLWGLKKEKLNEVVKKILSKRGLKANTIFLTTGLWATVELTDGHFININDYEIQKEL